MDQYSLFDNNVVITKPQTVRKLYSYMGSKRVHLDIINDTISEILKGEDTNNYNYYELFLGSAIVFLNLRNNFNKYILNDKQEDLTYFFRAYKDVNKERINKIIDFESINYKIETNKDGYYKFRDEVYNANKFETMVDKFITLFMLGNTCINSMLRWGPNGFNQSFGNRKYSNKIDNVLDSVKYCMDKNIVVSATDFKQILNNNINDNDNNFLFLDPPYATADMSCKWDISDTNYLCEWLLMHKNNHFIYFDSYEGNVVVQKLIDNGISYKLLNKIRDVAPNNKSGERKIVTEIMLYR